MPTGKPIDWDKYKKKWLLFDGTIQEFCKKHKLVLSTAYLHLKQKDKQKISKKINKKKQKSFEEQIERKAEKEGINLANKVLKIQDDNLKLVEKINEKVKDNINENKLDFDELDKLSRIIHKLTGATKNIIDYTKNDKNDNVNHKEIFEFDYTIIKNNKDNNNAN